MQSRQNSGLVLAVLTMLSTSMPNAASAQQSEKIHVTTTATLISDYRFRGVSLSDRKPALQGGIDLERDGWFAGGWATTLGRQKDAGLEVDLRAGRKGQVAGLHYTIAGNVYLYPDLPDSRYVEIQTFVGKDIGRGQVTLETSFAPKQNGLPFENIYIGMQGDLPIAPAGLSLVARGGYEDGFFRRKFDWEFGARYTKGPVTLMASIVGSSLGSRFAPRADGRTGLLLSVSGSW
ncbi:TorF family putative porin [Sphingomonas sp. RT2P30]|uniref:TorF family putative porin n=1 Tax=Parasphingomonas halimpatiens TaxID=3096162 RepID=UPI002FCAA89A